MLPVFNMLSNVAGGIGQMQDINRGMGAYKNYVDQGTNQLKSGMDTATQGFSPYTGAGQAGASGELNAVQNRQQAQTPTLSNTSAAGVSQWLDPSMNFSQDQARKQATAAGVAGGAMGGGMLKALSNNANQMAMTNWNNAANQQLSANNQNFGQQQQNYQNNNDFQQQQIGNYGNIANRGMQSQNALQGLLGNYNQGINQNFTGLGNTAASAWNAKGNVTANMFNSLGSGMDSLGSLSSIFGGGK